MLAKQRWAKSWHYIVRPSYDKVWRCIAMARQSDDALWLCDEKRSHGKAKMDNVMAERSGVECRQSKDLKALAKL